MSYKAISALTGRSLVAFLLFALAVGGCGKKGDPMPPLRTIPLATKDLAVRQQGNQILLELTYPATTASGMALGGVEAVEVFAVTKPATPAAALPTAEPFEFRLDDPPLLTLRGTELDSAVVGDRIQVRLPVADPLPASPTATIFAVRTRKGDETSDLSNRVALLAQQPPAPPSRLGAEAQPRGIELTWQLDGEAQGFDVYRRLATERGYGEPVERVPGANRRYLDATARYGERYIYTVRTVAGTRPLVHSEPAGEREIDYVDRFAPRLPANFVALPEQGAIRLRWDPSPDADVAGYVLLRRDPARTQFARISAELVSSTEYLDQGLASGLSFEYRLQVVDQLGNESAPSAAISATTR